MRVEQQRVETRSSKLFILARAVAYRREKSIRLIGAAQGMAAPITFRLVSVSVPLLLILLSAESVAYAEDAHDVLPLYGLPKGLLPDSIVSNTLSENGEFMVELAVPCYIHFTYLVYYEKIIRGKLSYGTISDLSGIQAKQFLFWVSLTGIEAHPADGTIEFKVGFLSQTLPASEFDSIRQCKSKAFGRGFFPEELLPAVSEVSCFPYSFFPPLYTYICVRSPFQFGFGVNLDVPIVIVQQKKKFVKIFFSFSLYSLTNMAHICQSNQGN